MDFNIVVFQICGVAALQRQRIEAGQTGAFQIFAPSFASADSSTKQICDRPEANSGSVREDLIGCLWECLPGSRKKSRIAEPPNWLPSKISVVNHAVVTIHFVSFPCVLQPYCKLRDKIWNLTFPY
jgi:hypothetical protein